MSEASDNSAWLDLPGGERVILKGTCSIGRSPSNLLALPHDKVSRRHAIVHAQENNEFWLVDLGSSNGTCLNGRRVTRPIRLRNRDQIDIGPFQIAFCQPPREQTEENAAVDSEKTIHEISSAKCWLLVADMESSTQLTQKLAADALAALTGRWLAECKQIVEESGGSINKFLGDGFFAYWRDREKIALSVIRALEALARLQAGSQPCFRIVVHYGQILPGAGGSMGEESLLGPEVNFVFRMEKLAGIIGRPRLSSQPASGQLMAGLSLTEIGRYPLAGFDGDFSFFAF